MSNIPKPGAGIPAPKVQPVKPAAQAPKPLPPAPVKEPEVIEEHAEVEESFADDGLMIPSFDGAEEIPEPVDVPARKVQVSEKVQAPKAEKEFAVEAIEKGYYGNIRRNPGDKFMCTPKLFSKLWMKKI